MPGRCPRREAGLAQVLNGVRRIKLTLSYDGTEYNGWQVQPGLPTIQGLLEEAFLDIEKAPVHVAGSGRTDAGVHALAQVAAVSIRNPIPTRNLKKALNRLLPFDIRVIAVEEAHENFIRVSMRSQRRTNTGCIAAKSVRPSSDAMYIIIRIRWTMRSSSTPRVNLKANSTSPHSPLRMIAMRKSDRKCGASFHRKRILTDERLIYRVTGSGFLKHMVRNIVGTLLEVGKGNVDAERLRWLLTAPPDIKAGPTAPACGLFLIEVHYESNDPATIGTRSVPTADA